MQWLRSQVRWGAALALFALVCQLALSFGHVHDVHQPHQLAATSSEQATSASSADADEPPGDPNDHCSICIVTGLVSASLISEPPALSKLLPARSLQIAWDLEHSAPAQRCAS